MSSSPQAPFVHPFGASFSLAWLWLRLPRLDATLTSPSVSMLAAILTPVAVLAGVLGVWRLAADPGWTTKFFITGGLLAHWQVWFTVAIGARVSCSGLNKWLEKNSNDGFLNE